MSNQCKVSVIVPVYNVEDYLRETLDSIVNQTLDDFEIILIDDGSSDNSPNIIKEYEEKYNNVISIFQNNSGPGQARNNGIQIARGKYIVFVDSDDVLPRDSLEVRYNIAEETESDIVVCATCMYDGEKMWPVKTHFFEEGAKDIKKNYELFWMMGPCNKIYATDLIRDIEFPKGINYGEDQVFVTKAYIRAKKIFSSQYISYYYRIRKEAGGSLTQQVFVNPHNVINDIKKSWILALEEINSYIDNEHIARELEKAYLIRLIDINIWPPFKKAIVSRDINVQIEAIKGMIEILDTIDPIIFNQLEKLRWILINGVIDKFLFLSSDAKKQYIELLVKAYKKLDDYNINQLRYNYKRMMKYVEKSVKHNSEKYIYFYLVRRNISRRITKFKNKVDRNSNKVMFYMCSLLPTKKSKVILASNKSDSLTGNLKSIYYELKERNISDVKLYLDSKRSKIETLKMYYDFATAKTILLDDYYRQLYGLKFKKNVEIIQVWHACGAFKKFGFSAIGKKDGNSAKFEERAHSHYTKVIASSKNIKEEYSEAFNIDKNNVLALGVPRTDNLLDNDYKEYITNKLLDENPMLENKKIITYAPTFRGGAKERQQFKLKLDPVRILRELGDEYVLVLKLHPSVKFGLNDILEIPNEFTDRILSLDSSIDINELLVITDIVITDYSSVVFEAALLDKKILFYAYDKQQYLGERDFYYDYDEFVPGPIAYSNTDIIEVIKDNKFDSKKVEVFRNKFFDSNDGKASKRLVDYITSTDK
ncbi:CDP-glycerol:glycerophosphate glycerophosphotransferase [Clostridium sardiniense]|uniref:CDP-glycerol:glycerophosphate glycerophosphotransferase n=1 Tax=Clostridium sardiniense TaxID=29369 RepID=A0ABS7KYK8_CLOSR|nr:CDP-glycerol glycerophosphotransferase family protein [Clostridium sardiniense]MBY0755905.1 CDP-glycerol:glycerophosphate glycerophosphotransferase [Clostridium sardiniense]MDQ0461365.1 CDP-glycerol glycerophosphotransferase (TagB/SpsB family)/GT2 family glycosyltransferase [Clostridium sardiniense]